METKEQLFEFKCPQCGATPGKHGKGGADSCEDGSPLRSCAGIICNCDFDSPGYDEPHHGETHQYPCSARCYHCEWEGTLPQRPKKLQAWEKRALAAGWTPPPSWCKAPEGVVD